MTAGPIGPNGVAAEPAGASADRGLVLVSAAYLEELEDAAGNAAIDARADEETIPFRGVDCA